MLIKVLLLTSRQQQIFEANIIRETVDKFCTETFKVKVVRSNRGCQCMNNQKKRCSVV